MQDDEQAIRQLVATWMEATRVGDGQTVLDLMTEDVVFLVAGGPPMIGKAAFAEAMQAMEDAPVFDGRSEIQEIRVVGDWAYMRSHLAVTVMPPDGGKPLKRAGHTLSVLRKQNGKWRLARDANMLMPVEE